MAFRWDARTARYRDARGRYVSRASVVRAVNQSIGKTERRMLRAARQVRAGDMSIDEFHQRMYSEVKQVHINTYAVARGGYRQLSQQDFGRIGANVQRQYAYIDRFMGELEAGVIPFDGRYYNRVAQYARSARTAYWAEDSRQHEESGYTEERSVLHPAEHCVECLREAELGWVPIGTIIPPGQRQCRGNCRCTKEYRTRAG